MVAWRLCSTAVCLDRCPPAYHLHQGSGAGARGWLLQFEGGGWCNDARSCAGRARTSLGSSSLMNKLETFSGLLSNDPAMNPGRYLSSIPELSFSQQQRKRTHTSEFFSFVLAPNSHNNPVGSTTNNQAS